MTTLTMIQKMATGLGRTFAIFFLTLAFSLPLGVILALLRRSKVGVLRGITRTLISILRGTPLMLQLLAVTYGPYYISKFLESQFGLALGIGVARNKLVPIIAGFAINYAAYFAEIYRGGIQSVPAGQEEAGLVLGMTKTQIFFKVKLMQMIKRIVPPMSNEIITLVKDTSLARIIALQEIIWAGQAFMKGSQGIAGEIWPLFFTAVYYLIFNGVLTVLLERLERKLDYFR